MGVGGDDGNLIFVTCIFEPEFKNSQLSLLTLSAEIFHFFEIVSLGSIIQGSMDPGRLYRPGRIFNFFETTSHPSCSMFLGLDIVFYTEKEQTVHVHIMVKNSTFKNMTL